MDRDGFRDKRIRKETGIHLLSYQSVDSLGVLALGSENNGNDHINNFD
jgi:hypothetical protein